MAFGDVAPHEMDSMSRVVRDRQLAGRVRLVTMLGRMAMRSLEFHDRR